MKKKDQKVRGQIMVGVGFLMIVFNAVSYFISNETFPVVGILGLVFVAVGLRESRTSK